MGIQAALAAEALAGSFGHAAEAFVPAGHVAIPVPDAKAAVAALENIAGAGAGVLMSDGLVAVPISKAKAAAEALEKSALAGAGAAVPPAMAMPLVGGGVVPAVTPLASMGMAAGESLMTGVLATRLGAVPGAAFGAANDQVESGKIKDTTITPSPLTTKKRLMPLGGFF